MFFFTVDDDTNSIVNEALNVDKMEREEIELRKEENYVLQTRNEEIKSCALQELSAQEQKIAELENKNAMMQEM